MHRLWRSGQFHYGAQVSFTLAVRNKPNVKQVAEEHLKAVLTATAQKSGAEDNVNLMAAMRKGEHAWIDS